MLFYNTASHLEFKRIVSNIYELTDFLVNKISRLDFGSEFPHKVVYQDCCSSLRDLHLRDEGRKLLSHVKGLELLEMQRPELCCGFGSGFFSIQHEALTPTTGLSLWKSRRNFSPSSLASSLKPL